MEKIVYHLRPENQTYRCDAIKEIKKKYFKIAVVIEDFSSGDQCQQTCHDWNVNGVQQAPG